MWHVIELGHAPSLPGFSISVSTDACIIGDAHSSRVAAAAARLGGAAISAAQLRMKMICAAVSSKLRHCSHVE